MTDIEFCIFFVCEIAILSLLSFVTVKLYERYLRKRRSKRDDDHRKDNK